MFGLSEISRHVRRWQANYRRAALQRAMLDLPLDLRKDIGWPGPGDRTEPGNVRHDYYARPML